MLSLSRNGRRKMKNKFHPKVDFSSHLIYTSDYIGGINVNEFEQNPQSKNHDVTDSIKGFTFSFVFFILIFVIGVVVSVVTQ